MDSINNGALPPLMTSDSQISGVLSSSGLNQFVGAASFLGPLTVTSTTPMTITDTLLVSALTVTGITKLGTAAGASVSIGTTSASLLSFYGHSAVLQPTAAGSAVVSGLILGTATNCVSSSTTFDNYTLQQFVTAVRATGLIA